MTILLPAMGGPPRWTVRWVVKIASVSIGLCRLDGRLMVGSSRGSLTSFPVSESGSTITV